MSNRISYTNYRILTYSIDYTIEHQHYTILYHARTHVWCHPCISVVTRVHCSDVP